MSHMLRLAGHMLKLAVEETPLGRRWRIEAQCSSWKFDLYRVLTAAGLRDRDPVLDAEYEEYLRYKAEPARAGKVVTFRRYPKEPS